MTVTWSGALEWCDAGSPVVAGNLGVLREAALRGAEVEAHWSLNAVNSHAVDSSPSSVRTPCGSRRSSPVARSPTLRHSSAVPLGMAVWGAQEIMVTEHCVLMAEGPCARNCSSCGRRTARRLLQDRKGYRFPVTTDLAGRSHVYNSVPLDLVPVLDEVLSTGVRAVRLDLQMLPTDEAVMQVRRVAGMLEAIESGIEISDQRTAGTPTTTGHFFRGLI